MILEMTAGSFLFNQLDLSQGSSEIAVYITKKREEGQSLLLDSQSLYPNLKNAIEELYQVAEECGTTGWDGETAKPVNEGTFILAYHFLKALPLGITAPSVSAEPDGYIVFEWYFSTTWVLSVSISQDGFLHYAALLGPRKAYGAEPFIGFLSKIILDLIQQIPKA